MNLIDLNLIKRPKGDPLASGWCKRACWCIAAVSLLVGFPGGVWADGERTAVKVGPLLTIADETATGLAPSGAVAYNAVNDEYFVVWLNSSASVDLFGRGVPVDGGFAGEAQVLVSGDDPMSAPSIAHDPSHNHYLLAWRGLGNHAYARLISESGAPVTDPWDALVASREMTAVFDSNVGTEGEYFLFGRSLASGSPNGVYGGWIESGGGGASSIPIELGGTPGPAGRAALNESDSQVLVTWRDQVDYELRGRIVNADGSFATDSFLINSVFPTAVIATGAAYDPIRERYLVVFGTFQGGPIRGQFVSADGTLDGGAVTLVDSVEEEFPCLAYDPVNQVYLLVWYSYSRVHCQLVSLDGALLGEPVDITSAWTSFYPSVAASTDHGGFLVVWHRTNGWAVGGQLIGVGGGDVIFSNGFEAGHTLLWNATVP